MVDHIGRIAVSGWEHARWQGAFYPSDMPLEWRFAYFNTQFHGLYLPKTVWQGLGEPVWQALLADCHHEFVFLLDMPEKEVMPTILAPRARSVRGEEPDVVWFDSSTNLKDLSGILARRPGGVTWLISRDADLAQIERVRTLLGILGWIA